ncbi:DUF2127 domain-containing protein [Cyanobium sp. Morenito 9A2]|uniref:DUF2127 domain-containing protein n=1 Tax=Cyanobium sp. Morenito 9A2 TaxID=2823718 RepID=UPI0020CD208A|nr:DUF2127 domain-containing protein [Cyanobium sp. Morenito 9A2]MCP9849093.1 DUF2127 domain-containing protein [Cyanobium sp. Morenito 9A2]
MERPSLLLRLIVVKKLIVAALLLAVSVLAAYGYRHYDGLAALADQWGEADRHLLQALILKGLDLGSHRLQITAELAGGYGLVVLVAAVATWRRLRWGEVLFAMLLTCTLPFEVIEVAEHVTAIHLLVLGLTLLGLVVVLRELTRPHTTAPEDASFSPR